MSEGAADSILLDLRGLRCPLPVLRVRKALLRASAGATLSVLSDDPLAAVDIPNFVQQSGDKMISAAREGAAWRFIVRRNAAEPELA